MDTEVYMVPFQKARKNTKLKDLSCNISKLQTATSGRVPQVCEILTSQITLGEFCSFNAA